jgi:hypothetical protein
MYVIISHYVYRNTVGPTRATIRQIRLQCTTHATAHIVMCLYIATARRHSTQVCGVKMDPLYKYTYELD